MIDVSKNIKIRNEQDTAWKEVLDLYFKDCVSYCLPELNAMIDWSKPYLSLDKEFQAITKGTTVGKRLLDKLFKVHLKDDREQWILIHIEVQGKPDNDFPKRMFTYAYRIYDKYQMPVVSCAILTDAQKKWRPHHYQVGLAGSYLSAEFLVVKIMDYQTEKATLEASNNPFANVIFVQLMAIEAKHMPDEQKKRTKFALTKRLFEKGFHKKEVINLYKFIDWLIGLPKPLELEYLNDVHKLEESKKMPYISSAERLGMEIGIKKGMEQGMEKGIQKGMEQGIQKGMEKGIKKGIEKGIERGIEIVAKHMLEEGAKITFIKKTTGLSLARIKKLQGELKENKH